MRKLGLASGSEREPWRQQSYAIPPYHGEWTNK